MVWYNTDKPHMSLNFEKAETPIQGFIRKLRPKERIAFLKRYKEDGEVLQETEAVRRQQMVL